MEKKTARLFFIDAMRAWAILMMLQGHFIDGLLDVAFKDNTNTTYTIWKYFRGITAPVFFTVSGFIFTYLLIKVPQKGWQNPRVLKGIKRGLQLLFIGYLLRANLFGILKGEIYDAFFLVDVLHCIGLSLLGIIGIYLLAQKTNKALLSTLLLGVTVLLFLFEPLYEKWTFGFLPQALANFLTRANGSVFTIIPWFGYTTFGAFLSVLFTRYKNHKFLYEYAILLSLLTGIVLIFFSSDLFLGLSDLTGATLFEAIAMNNYLFIRLGDVFLVFAVFMLFRGLMTHPTLLKIGQSTLSIYIIHFIILYGSFTGLGLYKFFHHQLSPMIAISGAIVFMIVCAFTALQYEKNKVMIKSGISIGTKQLYQNLQPWYSFSQKLIKGYLSKVLRSVGRTKTN
ncbi:heparan-alpha-glucosaminide N-acetyltransferase domain-containing protein [Maribacter polysiphoniae]|uniref:heparan-alpha-glucosaminide N-acetyltransferase domain-containing protein n=1 Tax=Maribacter polysiphoniae TaxID=429344 RepID=UPI00235774FD|nr:heparan-alpha-glucosaminide N-acetyltransferase domain-containing protein [Maribacter polysiphoniae]